MTLHVDDTQRHLPCIQRSMADHAKSTVRGMTNNKLKLGEDKTCSEHFLLQA